MMFDSHKVSQIIKNLLNEAKIDHLNFSELYTAAKFDLDYSPGSNAFIKALEEIVKGVVDGGLIPSTQSNLPPYYREISYSSLNDLWDHLYHQYMLLPGEPGIGDIACFRLRRQD